MSKLLSLAIRSLPPHGLCSRVHAPVLRKMSMPLLHHNQPRCAFTLTAFTSMDTNDDDVNNHFLYEPLEEVERFENYRPGGYHPIQIGDHFHSRYRVVHKLGHGSYSTMWLAYDEQSNKYVALKVCIANSNPKEVDIISTLTRPHYSVHNPGKTMVPSILDKFTIHGPNGNHTCYVTATARVSLSGAKDGSWIRLFQLDVARSLSAQLVLAVDYVHARGIVHGDIHLGNIILKVPPNFDLLTLDKLYEKYGAPELEPIVRLNGNPDTNPLPPGVPSHAITPVWLGEASEKITLAEARILLTDFGEAFSPSKELRYESHTPLVLRPPEVRFEPKKPLSFSSDIWTLACTIWSIVAQRPLFEGCLATEDDITCEHVDTLGVLPPKWWKRWEARQNKFTEDGKPINRPYNDFRSWDDRFEDSVEKPRRDKGIPSFDAKERDAIFDMLRPMLSFRPEDRPSTKQILESEWMVKWALPEYGKIQNNT